MPRLGGRGDNHRLNGAQLEEFCLALEDAFDSIDRFDAMLQFKCDKSRESISLKTSLPAIIRDVVNEAERNSWSAELLQGALQAEPANVALLAFAEQFKSPSIPNPTRALEREKLRKGNEFTISDINLNELVPIPKGLFLKGKDAAEQVELGKYSIDKYPVTNIQYFEFVKQTEWRYPIHWAKGRIPEGLEYHPVVNLTWEDAYEYARWLGKKLPSSEQWEKAARGVDGRRFPWGNRFDISKANTRESGIMNTTDVRTYFSGQSPFEVLDMSGNVWEWTRTENEQGRVIIRGGAFNLVASYATCFYFSTQAKDYSHLDLGFRCVLEFD